MAASSKKSLALDTNLLLDLAGEKDFAHEFKEEFSSRGYALLVPPTVIAELAFFASLKEAPQHEIANVALESVASSQALQLRSSSSSILSSPARARAGWCGPSSIRPRFRSYGCHFVPAVRWWS